LRRLPLVFEPTLSLSDAGFLESRVVPRLVPGSRAPFAGGSFAVGLMRIPPKYWKASRAVPSRELMPPGASSLASCSYANIRRAPHCHGRSGWICLARDKPTPQGPTGRRPAAQRSALGAAPGDQSHGSSAPEHRARPETQEPRASHRRRGNRRERHASMPRLSARPVLIHRAT